MKGDRMQVDIAIARFNYPPCNGTRPTQRKLRFYQCRVDIWVDPSGLQLSLWLPVC